MNFYYHPILGLQYTYLGDTLFMDTSDIPYGLSYEEFLENWDKIRFHLLVDITEYRI